MSHREYPGGVSVSEAEPQYHPWAEQRLSFTGVLQVFVRHLNRPDIDEVRTLREDSSMLGISNWTLLSTTVGAR
jgi:hypothetical protein